MSQVFFSVFFCVLQICLPHLTGSYRRLEANSPNTRLQFPTLEFWAIHCGTEIHAIEYIVEQYVQVDSATIKRRLFLID